MTHNELIERAARAVFRRRARGIPFEKSLSGRAFKEDARTVIRVALEEAIKVVHGEAVGADEDPTDIAYDTAISHAASAIRALLPQEDGE